MPISAIDLFSIGIGPSSSHTVGPMKAAEEFLKLLGHVPDSVRIELHGSLALTGRGHGTDRATLLGLVGWTPTSVSADIEPVLGATIPTTGTLSGPAGTINYELVFNPMPAPEHPNCVTLSAEGMTRQYFSVGGGFILTKEEMDEEDAGAVDSTITTLPYPYTSWEGLRRLCSESGLTIAEIVDANEAAMHGSVNVVNDHLDKVWATMKQCVRDGLSTTGILPGGLGVQRRAPMLYQRLLDNEETHAGYGFEAMDWTNLFALAVNEENAAGGRIVTAPTNGAAGIIPAVMHYALKFLVDKMDHRLFLKTAAAIGIVIKRNASFSGAEVGCQGEVGSASAMAAAGLCALLGGTTEQIGNAAEIGLEHNLGLTCDPVGGLVQIPCIERNAIGGVKSINAARLAMHGDGTNRVSLDVCVETMARTGRDMSAKYKETSTGGLAAALGMPVSVTEC